MDGRIAEYPRHLRLACGSGLYAGGPSKTRPIRHDRYPRHQCRRGFGHGLGHRRHTCRRGLPGQPHRDGDSANTYSGSAHRHPHVGHFISHSSSGDAHACASRFDIQRRHSARHACAFLHAHGYPFTHRRPGDSHPCPCARRQPSHRYTCSGLYAWPRSGTDASAPRSYARPSHQYCVDGQRPASL